MMENIMPSITASCMVDNAITLILSSTILLPVPLTSYISLCSLQIFHTAVWLYDTDSITNHVLLLNLFRFRPVFQYEICTQHDYLPFIYLLYPYI